MLRRHFAAASAFAVQLSRRFSRLCATSRHAASCCRQRHWCWCWVFIRHYIAFRFTPLLLLFQIISLIHYFLLHYWFSDIGMISPFSFITFIPLKPLSLIALSARLAIIDISHCDTADYAITPAAIFSAADYLIIIFRQTASRHVAFRAATLMLPAAVPIRFARAVAECARRALRCYRRRR